MSRPVKIIPISELEDYSEIIDVRSPSEFAEDHMPGAINCYVLDDLQRAEVGTLYKQVSPFEAKKLGASLISGNIAHWTREHFLNKPKSYKALVYCWRGGQRSMSLATVLARIGWDISLVEGGYKKYRAQVRETLDTLCPKLNLTLITGLTGTAKTRILKQLEHQGEQMIDLEGLANHKGSLLGHNPEQPQPSQKYFESLLAAKIATFDTTKRIWVESESNKIGNLQCPAALWQQMKQAPAIEITAPVNARVQYLLSDYPYFTQNPEALSQKIYYLKELHGIQKIEQWRQFIAKKAWPEFVQQILEQHYDPAYTRSMKYNQRKVVETIHVEKLNEEDIWGIADEMINK